MKQKKIKIAIVTPDFYPQNIGGCGISAHLLFQELKKAGYFVSVFSFDHFSKISKNKKFEIHRYKAYPKFPLLNNIFAYFKLVKKLSNYDVVHTYNMDLIPVCSMLTKKNRLVATINNTKGAIASTYSGKRSVIHKIHDWLVTKLIQACSARVAVFIALTNSLRHLYIKNGFAKEKIFVIPNMYDPVFQKTKKAQSKEYDFLFVGQLSKKKGVLLLLDAFKLLQNKVSNENLLIIGKGSQRETIKRFIHKHALHNKIKILGVSYKELPSFYRKSKVLVSPSLWFEPFSRTWLEALASDLPVVSSKNPSALEFFKNEFAFYASNTPDSLATAMKKALRKANNFRYTKNSLARFAPKKVFQKIESRYYELMSA